MFKADTEIIIRRPGAPADGMSAYAEIPARALKCDKELRDAGEFPAVKCATSFLVPPPELPRIGDSIVCGGRSYVVKSVRLCRDLDGKVVAARCITE